MKKPTALTVELDTKSIRARPGGRLKDRDAKRVAPVLFRIYKTSGLLTPEAVVEEARNPASPLHRFFEWDDTKAAETYRRQTAQIIIRSVSYRVKYTGEDAGKYLNDHQPALVQVKFTDDEKRIVKGYVPIVKALTDDVLRAQVVATAKREYESWMRRYRTLEALAGVMPLAEQLWERLQKAA